MVDNHLAKESCKKRKRSCDPKAQAKAHCVPCAFWHNNDNFGYALNDIVLIILWMFASLKNPAYIPVTINFSIFFFNDMYGFICWKKRETAL